MKVMTMISIPWPDLLRAGAPPEARQGGLGGGYGVTVFCVHGRTTSGPAYFHSLLTLS